MSATGPRGLVILDCLGKPDLAIVVVGPPVLSLCCGVPALENLDDGASGLTETGMLSGMRTLSTMLRPPAMNISGALDNAVAYRCDGGPAAGPLLRPQRFRPVRAVPIRARESNEGTVGHLVFGDM